MQQSTDEGCVLKGVRVVIRFLQKLIIAFGLSILANPALAQEPLPLEAYGELPGVERVTISPSGKRIGLLTTIRGKRVLIALEGGKPVGTPVTVGDMKIRSIRWVGEERMMIIASQTERLGANFTTDKHEFYVARILPVTGDTKPGIVFGNRKELVDAISGNYGIRLIDGRWYGFFGATKLEKSTRLTYHFDHGRPYLYRVDLENFKTKEIAPAVRAGLSSDWVVDAQGNVAAALTVDDESGEWVLRRSHNKVIAKGQNQAGRISLIGLGYDGSTVLVSENIEGRTQWREYPLAGGEAKPFLRDVSVDELYFSDTTGYLIGYLEGGSIPKPIFAKPEHASSLAKVRKAFSTFEMDVIDWTDNLKHVVVRTSGNKDSGTWFSVDIDSLSAAAIAYERMAIEPQHVGAISTFEYNASDGMELDGILTLPPGAEPKDLPLVMMPHGGPHSYDSPHFDWWAQAFASRGYAVFQPNFRGSTHKTQSFRIAGYGQWGRAMQSDKTDGLKALAAKGIIDPKRACIVGASYGGYAALAGVTLEQGIYRCAVAVAPVSDINNMYKEDYRASANDRTTKVSLLQQLGERGSWDEVSPLRNAAKADAPIMLIHGRDDTVVPYSHSTKMADKLKDAGKPYEMVTLKGEDHWLSLSETRQKMLKSAVEFVEKHNPAD